MSRATSAGVTHRRQWVDDIQILGVFVNETVTKWDALVLATLWYMEIRILFLKRIKPIVLVSRATSAGVTHRRQWVDDIQSAPFFLWVIHESKNEVVGNGLNKRIHAIFWQLNFQSRIKSWIFSQERKYDLEELSVSPQQLLKTRQVRPHFIISLFFDVLCFC